MAALQTLRNKPALLMTVIGGALLLFIVTLTDFNSCSRPNVEGEVNGKELTYEDYEAQVSSEENLETLILDNITEEQKSEVRQRIWTRFEETNVLAKEIDKLGLTVTTEDVQNEIASVTPQQLQQIAQALQYGQATVANISYAQRIMILMAKYIGQATVEGYKQFMKTADQQISQYQKQDPTTAEMIYNIKQACLYCESQIPQDILMNRYMSLLAQGALSNPISAKMIFDESSTTLNFDIATVPYTSINDTTINITDADLKQKYEETKEYFRQSVPTRDVKMINITVTASPKDQSAIMAQVQAVEDTLRKVSTAEDVENVMRASKTEVTYMNVYVPKDIYTQSSLDEVVKALDTLKVGGVTPTKVEARKSGGEQYISTYKLVDVKTTPDSLQICQLAVDSKDLADSIVAAVQGGKTLSAISAEHADVVQKYGLKGDTTWNAVRYYVESNADTSSVSPYTDICQIPVGTTAYYAVPNNQTGQPIYVVTSVLDSSTPSEKYNVAVVKYPIQFTQETYNNRKRALMEFLAKNRTIAEIEENAPKSGFTVIDRPNMSTSNAMELRYDIGGEGVRDAFIWTFDEAKEGEVSQVYECGTDNNRLLVVAVSKINDGDYVAWDNPSVKSQLEALVLRDKKAEQILASVKDVKDIEAAKKVKGVDFRNQPAVSLIQIATYEPNFAGALERTETGKFTGAIKGATGIYMVQVNNKEVSTTGYNEATAMLNGSRALLSKIFGQTDNIFDTMINKADIVDKRYKF